MNKPPLIENDIVAGLLGGVMLTAIALMLALALYGLDRLARWALG